MHILFKELQEKSPIPLISIVDATAEAIKDEGMKTIGLLGTRFTMENPFYKEGLKKHGIKSVVAEKADKDPPCLTLWETANLNRFGDEGTWSQEGRSLPLHRRNGEKNV